MEGFRAAPPMEVGGLAVGATLDYQAGEAREGGAVRRLTLPPANVLAYQLAGGSRITLRPSGTEPKIKYYFELREALDGKEPVAVARARAEEKIARLADAFLLLARERGQP